VARPTAMEWQSTSAVKKFKNAVKSTTANEKILMQFEEKKDKFSFK
jgi:hypothetical protein